MMETRRLLPFVFLFMTCMLDAQTYTDTIDYSLNARIDPGFGKYAPFLSTANQFDRHSVKPNSLSVWGTIHRSMDVTSRFDYGFGTELDANLSKEESRFFPGELYVEGKACFLNATVGMKRRIYGNQDQELSSGGMIWSRNSRPIPGISIESNDYIDVPFSRGFVEVKGGMSHGWFIDSTVTRNTLLHHKYAYIRLGGNFPVKLSFGLQHVCQWAGTSPGFGSTTANWNNFKRIFFGESGDVSSPDVERYNALGNHILSKNAGFDLKIKSADISLYWQNIYEDGPIYYMYKTFNVEDGLFGMSVKLRKFKPLNHFVLEYMSTTDQSGPWHDLDGVIYGGTDNYYNNGVYPNGWSFYGMAIGNPWLTSPKYNENGSISFLNNKVRLYYMAASGDIHKVSYKAIMAYSENWGSPSVIYEKCKRQLSYQIEASTALKYLNNTRVSFGLSGDRGKMYGNNFALMLGVSYSGNIIY